MSLNTTSNYRVHIGPDGVMTEPVYLCRCGLEHIGPYAIYDYGHHMCFHDAPLMKIHDDYFCCVDCGKDFHVDGDMRTEYDIRGGERGKYLPWWRQIISYLQALYR